MKNKEIINRYNILSVIQLVNGNDVLSGPLKVKIISERIKSSKLVDSIKSDIQKFIEGLIDDNVKELANKQDKTEEDIKKLAEFEKDLQEQQRMYIYNREQEEAVDFGEFYFTEDEYYEIVNVNSKDVVINGNEVKLADFLEYLYKEFVK